MRWRWWLLANTQVLELILLQHPLLHLFHILPLLFFSDDVGEISDLTWLDVPRHWHVLLLFGRKHLWLMSDNLMPDSWFLILNISTLKGFHQGGEILREPLS